jgi:hypothetical protein
MTWQEKFAALQRLCPTHLEMRKPGDWYVAAHRREMTYAGYGFLSGRYGNGATPEEAVEDDWRQVAEGDPWYVVLDAMGPSRRHLRWDAAAGDWVAVAPGRGASRPGGG